jgi:hypothetical protein
LCARVTLDGQRIRQSRKLPDGHGAKTQMHTQVTWAFDRRKIAGLFIKLDALGKIWRDVCPCVLRC